jgi:hypothetical protein
MGKKIYSILVGKPAGKRALERPRPTGKDDTKWKPQK